MTSPCAWECRCCMDKNGNFVCFYREGPNGMDLRPSNNRFDSPSGKHNREERSVNGKQASSNRASACFQMGGFWEGEAPAEPYATIAPSLSLRLGIPRGCPFAFPNQFPSNESPARLQIRFLSRYIISREASRLRNAVPWASRVKEGDVLPAADILAFNTGTQADWLDVAGVGVCIICSSTSGSGRPLQ